MLRAVTDGRAALSVLGAGFILLGFATPLHRLWEQPALAWWAPFALWGLALLLVGAGRRGGEGP
jgi:uncharacterized protein (DUF983 family)